nr:MAG TPA: hypothetical protein [Caudoviricetes sp.]
MKWVVLVYIYRPGGIVKYKSIFLTQRNKLRILGTS